MNTDRAAPIALLASMHPDPRISFPRYVWPEGKRCAVVFSLDLDAESPYVWLNRGKAVEGLSEIEQRRFGPRQGVARVLELLARHEIRASFYVPGLVAATYPDLLPTLLKAGHEIGYHGYYHERLDQVTSAEAQAYLYQTIAVYRKQTGLSGLGYRSASWQHTPETLRQLSQAGVAYDSSLMGFDHPYELDDLVELPVTWTIDDALYFRYTNGPRDKTHPANPAAVLETWIEEFEGLREWGGLFMITVHDWISGRAQRLRMLDRLFMHLRAAGDAWICTSRELADYHRASPNAGRHRVAVQGVDTAF
jgi:peptidoglycan/xylan/chitin deacetylase (PgdA/CDA1 family)